MFKLRIMNPPRSSCSASACSFVSLSVNASWFFICLYFTSVHNTFVLKHTFMFAEYLAQSILYAVLNDPSTKDKISTTATQCCSSTLYAVEAVTIQDSTTTTTTTTASPNDDDGDGGGGGLAPLYIGIIVAGVMVLVAIIVQ